MLMKSVIKQEVNLQFYHPTFEMQLENYYLPEEQLKFTGLPLANIEKCKLEIDRHPILIVSNNEIAGFFVLHEWEGVKAYSVNKQAILLRAYSVNTPYQGKGIAKLSLQILPSFVKEHFPEKNEIILAVNHKNLVAQHVYKKGGFIDKGVRVMGRKGELLILHMDL